MEVVDDQRQEVQRLVVDRASAVDELPARAKQQRRERRIGVVEKREAVALARTQRALEDVDFEALPARGGADLEGRCVLRGGLDLGEYLRTISGSRMTAPLLAFGITTSAGGRG